MSFGIPVRNGLSISLLSTTALSTGRRLVPALNLNFLSASGALDPRITFSRGSNATLTDSTGRLTYAPSNLLTNSESFQATSGTVWSLESATATSNFATAPDGTATAERLLEATATSTHAISQTLTVAAATHCFSVYLKKGSGTTAPDWVQLSFGGTAAAYANFNLATGVVGVTSGTVATITDVGSGWFRCSITAVPTAGSMSVQIVFTNNTNSATRRPSYAGQTTSDVLIWGAQLEQVTYQTTPGTYNSTTPKNLLGFTQEFDNAAWTKSNAFVQTNLATYSEGAFNTQYTKSGTPTVTDNSVTSPTGSNTASSISGAGTGDYIYRDVSTTIGVTYVRSIYVSNVNADQSRLVVRSASSACDVYINWTGAVLSSLSVSVGAASFTAVGGGWYRVSLVYAALETTDRLRITPNALTGTKTINIWGAQLVQGSVAGDYQRTDAAAAAVQYYAPDGSLTADKLVETTAASTHLALQAATLAASPYVFSAYLKAGERTFASLAIDGLNAWFNLSTGALGTVETGLTGAITSVGNGWYRCSVTRTVATAGSKSAAIYTATANNTVSYTGDGTSGIYIWGAQLSDSASLDPYVYNPAAAAASTAYYGPRFDYDPLTLAPKGLLIEEARTNLYTYSDQLNNAAWTAASASVSANTTTAPDGTLSADTLIEDNTNNVHTVSQSPVVSASTTYTWSVYAKRASGTRNLYLQANLNSGTTGAGFAWFDLAAGTASSITTLAGTFVGVSATMTSVGNGWYRCTLTFTANAGNTSATCYTSIYNAARSYTGDATSGLFLWGEQFEAGSFATSYIPTVASTVTRSADVAAMRGDNFASWYNLNAGTFVVSGSIFANQGAVTVNFIQASNGSSNSFAIDLGMYDTTAPIFQVINSTTQASLDLGTLSLNTPFTMAGAYSTNDFAGTISGAAVQTDTSGTVPSGITQLGIGNRLSGPYMNGHIRSIGYYNTRQPNATLQTLTNPSTTPSLALNFISDTYTVGA